MLEASIRQGFERAPPPLNETYAGPLKTQRLRQNTPPTDSPYAEIPLCIPGCCARADNLFMTGQIICFQPRALRLG